MSLPNNMPATLTVTVNGTDCTIVGKVAKSGNVYYKGSVTIPELVDDPTPVLAAVTAAFEGKPLNAGQVHVSEPQKYRAGHEKAGQVRPGTGGRQTVTHSKSVIVNGHRFTLMVTVTYDEKGFVLSAKAIPPADPTLTAVGLTFAAVKAA